jgi:hypothetical protein
MGNICNDSNEPLEPKRERKGSLFVTQHNYANLLGLIIRNDTPIFEVLNAIAEEMREKGLEKSLVDAGLLQWKRALLSHYVVTVADVRAASVDSWEAWKLPTGVADALKTKLGIEFNGISVFSIRISFV